MNKSENTMESKYFVEIRNLKKHFTGGRLGHKSVVKAVDGIDLQLREGQTLGLVGESGCGKSTLSRLLLRLIPATEGEILLDGEDILQFDKKRMRETRREIQMIFQNPYTSLNPRMRILDAVKAPLDVFSDRSEADKVLRIHEIFDMVGLDKAFLDRYPHEFSGGQRQRIAIARALVLNPRFIICDEPVSALDVSVRAQVLNLMRSIRDEFGISYMFISHDLSVVHHISDNVAVMYLGKIVEKAPKHGLYDNPLHPYTRALLSAVLQPQGKKRERIVLQGEVPSPINVPSGCRFRTRCPLATDECAQSEPPLRDVGDDHWVACHRTEERGGVYEHVRPDEDFHI